MTTATTTAVANTVVKKTWHRNLQATLLKSGKKPGLLSGAFRLLGKAVKFLGPWGTALTVGVLALKGIRAIGNHPAVSRVV